MLTSNATVQAQDPRRLMTRLCKHWSHKLPVTQDDDSALIQLPMGTCRMSCGQVLTVTLESDAEQMPRLQQVVADHLIRMANKESQLVVEWQ